MPRSRERMLLDIIVASMRRLSDRDIEALIDGQARFVLESIDPAPASRGVLNPATDSKLMKVIAELHSAPSRDEANAILGNANLRSVELRKLMRILDLPVSRTDTVDKLHYKIVDSTVGYKLRSNAIRGPQGSDSLKKPGPTQTTEDTNESSGDSN